MNGNRNTNPSMLSGFVPAASRDNNGETAPQFGAVRLDPARVAAFNQVLQRVCPGTRDLQAGQIAAAARTLLFTDSRERGSASIARRIARVEELERMRADGGFALDTEVGARIRALLAYVENGDDLIPDNEPVVGQLDDAILVDLLLRDIGPELADYADFCAWRGAQAGTDGTAQTVDCDDWIDARRREIEATRERRRQGYAPNAVGHGFRVG